MSTHPQLLYVKDLGGRRRAGPSSDMVKLAPGSSPVWSEDNMMEDHHSFEEEQKSWLIYEERMDGEETGTTRQLYIKVSLLLLKHQRQIHYSREDPLPALAFPSTQATRKGTF